MFDILRVSGYLLVNVPLLHAQTGLQAHTVSTAVPVALAQPWLVAVAVFPVSVTDMVTLCKDTVTTRQASVTAPTTLRDRTASPAYLVTMEIPGKHLHFAQE